LDVPGLGRLGVTVMMRTALFPFNRARLRNTTPSPPALFEALARSFREAWASMEFRLPSLRECEAAHEARAQNPNKSVHVRMHAWTKDRTINPTLMATTQTKARE
jgi:hypothetical protein